MGAMSRRKGNAAELEVARLIEAWWQRVEPGCKFKRTPSSGGWLGAKGRDVRDAFGVGGDLCTTAKRFPFQLEVKRREAWNIDNFLAGHRSPVWAWWEQCTLAAASAGRMPMLWARKSRSEWIVVLDAIGQRGSYTGAFVRRGEHFVAVVAAKVLLERHPRFFTSEPP